MKQNNKVIWCCGCSKAVSAVLVTGAEVYPHREDLYHLPFWKCFVCGNYVGCHYKSKDRTRPLGCIPTQELRNARKHIHTVLDPLWRGNKRKRVSVYNSVSDGLGYVYHTADIKTLEEARTVYKLVLQLRREECQKHTTMSLIQKQQRGSDS